MVAVSLGFVSSQFLDIQFLFRMRLSSTRCAVAKMVVAALGVLERLAPLSPCITKPLARRNLGGVSKFRGGFSGAV